MNILLDRLPSTVVVDGAEYEINSDFRTSILFEMMMYDGEIDETEKISKALNLFYPIIPSNLNEAIDKAIWFYRGGKDNVGKAKNNRNNRSSSKPQQIYSFEYDDIYIYSAFLSQYNIDLQDIKYLHWWKFKALFNSLKGDNKIVEIMGYRAVKVTNDMTKEQKSFYSNMKKEYEIPLSDSELNRVNELEEALLNGEDISKLL
ncbi:MAG: bacteriophage Gp15 family protein [Bacilli bacterium]